MESVINFINLLSIDKNDYVVVAVSGGSDSMYLMTLLNKLGYKVVCAHVNHNVREESEYEYVFLENYCKENNIIFEGTKITKYKNNKFSEEEGREFRYNFFEKLLTKYNSKYLFTAHHGDDLIETVLMRIVRGSSLYGYRGFDMITDKGKYKIIRPLMLIDKKCIEDYLNSNDIEYVLDQTNYTDIHTRNRYRNHVLPFIKTEEKDAVKRFIKFNKRINDNHDYLMRVLDSLKNKVYDDKYIYINEFNNLDNYIKRILIEEFIRPIYPNNLYLIQDIHIDNILDFIEHNKNGVINLPSDVVAVIEYDKFYFKHNEMNIEYNFVFDTVLSYDNWLIKRIEESNDTSNNIIRLNSKDIKLPIIIRTRSIGDKMNVKNMNGSKKINDIFIDSKIGKFDRDKYPIVVDSNNNILWIPGIKKSNFDIPINDSYDIILWYEKEK